ncbi:MAG TPA: hypothetical protein VE987_06855 [Polyangiaceae bacterium]|nr:hypothetical protein [Polyangiaceae bacterium]
MAGCPAAPTALARGQEIAQEFNQDARFGRNELMIEHVAPAARDDFAAHHRAWGTEVRVADVELAGMKARGEHELEVLVRVAWYRPDEQELRVTTVEQRWQDANGWQLAAEKRVDGDLGLLGETVVRDALDGGARAPARFPTVQLRGTPPGP